MSNEAATNLRDWVAAQPNYLTDNGIEVLPAALLDEALRTERRMVVEQVRDQFAALSGQQIGHAYWNGKLDSILDEIGSAR